MTDQEELTNEMIRMFYEKPEFGNCSLCGRYDKLVPGEDWCYLCQEVLDEEDKKMKPLSERGEIFQIIDLSNTAAERHNLRLQKINITSEVAQLEAENEKLREIKLFCHAEAQTLCDGRDFSLAAYMLRDLPTTKRAELVDLCQAMSEETASKGDWEGLKQWWLEAVLKAGDDDDMA